MKCNADALIVGGGPSQGSGAEASAELYDPSSDTWGVAAPMAEPRKGQGVKYQGTRGQVPRDKVQVPRDKGQGPNTSGGWNLVIER